MNTVTTDRERVSTPDEAPQPAFPLTAAVTWALTLPLLALGYLAGALLVPAVVTDGAAQSGLHFLSEYAPTLLPEQREQTRFLLAIALAVALAVVSWLVVRRLQGRRPPARAFIVVALLAQVVLAGLVVWAWVVQIDTLPLGYFSVWQAVVAVAAGLVVVVVASRRAALPRVPSSRWITGLVLVIAAAITVYALLPALFSDRNAAAGTPEAYGHIPYTFDEFAAVVAGRTPTVDYVSQYSSVLPYLMAPVFSVLGLNVAAFSLTMIALSAVALLSVLVCLRMLVGSWPAAFALYVPFLALTLYPITADGGNVAYIAGYYAVMPLRYVGAWVTAAVCLWVVRSPSGRRGALLGAVAGLAFLNNFEFGLPGFVGAALALACALGRDWRTLRRTALGFGAGALGALVAFSTLTLVRSGELPDLLSLVYFSRQFATAGFYMLPMAEWLGLHAIIWATFAGCVVISFMRGLARTTTDGDRVATALMAFVGVFGMGSLAYYVGRTHPNVLPAVFGPWVVALIVLGVTGWRVLRTAPPRSPAWALAVFPMALVSGHLALAATTVTDDRGLTRQVERLREARSPEILREMPVQRAVQACARPGEAVAILSPLGQRVAASVGVRNVAPYNHPMGMATQEQLDRFLRALDEERVRKVFTTQIPVELVQQLGDAGYTIVRQAPGELRAEQYVPFTSAGQEVTVWTRGDAGCG